jgi:hypothetical protein
MEVDEDKPLAAPTAAAAVTAVGSLLQICICLLCLSQLWLSLQEQSQKVRTDAIWGIQSNQGHVGQTLAGISWISVNLEPKAESVSLLSSFSNGRYYG